MTDKLEFKVLDKDYYVSNPSPRQEKDGMIIFAKTLTKCIKEGILSQDKLDKYMREQGVWDDEKQKEMEELTGFVATGVKQLTEGGIKKSEARKLAIQMKFKRIRYMQLIMEKTTLQGCTAEALADRERTEFFVSCCTKNTDGSRAFPTLEDFQEKQETDLGQSASLKFAQLYNGFEEDYGAKKWPENQFLVKYGFANDKLELVNSEGKFVDVEGNVVEEPQKVEFKEFLDD